MLTERTLRKAWRQRIAYGEPSQPVPRDRGPSTPGRPVEAEAAGAGGQVRVWDEEKGAFLLRDEAPSPGVPSP